MKAKRPTIAITGANGFLGQNLINHFTSQNWQVVALVRKPENQPKRKGVTYRQYDLNNPVSDGSLKNVDYLVHAAYMKQTSKTPNAFDINVQAAKDILKVARTNKLKKSLFISSMSAHKGAQSVYGRQKLQIEKVFSGKGTVCLRPGLVIGNGGLVRNITDFMRKRHMVPVVGGGKQPLQIISVLDLATAIEQALVLPVNGVLTVANSHVYTYKEFYKALAHHLNTPVLFIPVPYALLSSLLKTIELLHLPLSVNQENLIGLKNLIAVDNKKDLQALQITPDNLETVLKKNIVE